MAYSLLPAEKPLNITEQRYAVAAEIETSGLDSCIAVVAKQGASLHAVHLVIRGNEGDLFDEAAVTRVLEILPGPYDSVKIAGCTDVWQNDVNQVSAAFNSLASHINIINEGLPVYCLGNGRCNALIVNGEIVITWH